LHLAADTGDGLVSPVSEVAFAHKLALQAADAGIPIVYCSSQAASADAPSAYGRTKHDIEHLILPLNAIVIRPGLVVGGRETGLFGLLVALVRRSPVLPDLLPRPMVQPIHVEDLAFTILAAVERVDLRGSILAAAGEPIAFVDLLSGIARYRLRMRRASLPVPSFMLRGMLAVAALKFGSQLSPSRLDSLVRLPVLDAGDDLAKLGISLRPVSSALSPSGQSTRCLLLEARALAQAITDVLPPLGLLRRYVRLLEVFGQRECLSLPKSLLGRRAWLAALDSSARKRQQAPFGGLIWRMNLMSRLAEAQPELADLYLMARPRSGRVAVIRGLMCACLREAHSRFVAPWARYIARGLK
jgi:NADH dehydrogenase